MNTIILSKLFSFFFLPWENVPEVGSGRREEGRCRISRNIKQGIITAS